MRFSNILQAEMPHEGLLRSFGGQSHEDWCWVPDNTFQNLAQRAILRQHAVNQRVFFIVLQTHRERVVSSRTRFSHDVVLMVLGVSPTTGNLVGAFAKHKHPEGISIPRTYLVKYCCMHCRHRNAHASTRISRVPSGLFGPRIAGGPADNDDWRFGAPISHPPRKTLRQRCSASGWPECWFQSVCFVNLLMISRSRISGFGARQMVRQVLGSTR